MNEYFPTVVQVIPLDNFHVQVFFDDGKIVDYDATEDLKAEIFKPLRDIDAFKEACTVMNGTLAVSYTHLDVYKRQEISWEPIKRKRRTIIKRNR